MDKLFGAYRPYYYHFLLFGGPKPQLGFTMRAWPVARSIASLMLRLCERSERADNKLDIKAGILFIWGVYMFLWMYCDRCCDQDQRSNSPI